MEDISSVFLALAIVATYYVVQFLAGYFYVAVLLHVIENHKVLLRILWFVVASVVLSIFCFLCLPAVIIVAQITWFQGPIGEILNAVVPIAFSVLPLLCGLVFCIARNKQRVRRVLGVA